MPTVALVVGDDEAFALVRRICEAPGFVIHQARDPSHAMRLVEQHSPAVVVTPRTLPDRDGLVWIAELRHALPDAVIAVTCETRDLTVLDAGADVVLVRPLDAQLIASTIQAAIAHDPVEPLLAKRIKLVIIEPDPHLSVVMKRWLGTTYDITLVGTAWRAIEEIRRAAPDAVLAELRMPDMDGAELRTAVEDIAPGLGERILFMTAGFVADKAQQFLARIPGQWIYKPFDLAKLRGAVEALLSA